MYNYIDRPFYPFEGYQQKAIFEQNCKISEKHSPWFHSYFIDNSFLISQPDGSFEHTKHMSKLMG